MIKVKINQITKENKNQKSFGRAERRRHRNAQILQSFLDMTSPDIEPGRIFEAMMYGMGSYFDPKPPLLTRWRVLTYVEGSKTQQPNQGRHYGPSNVIDGTYYSFKAILETDPEHPNIHPWTLTFSPGNISGDINGFPKYQWVSNAEKYVKFLRWV